jgi:hypothetical protein
MHIRGLNGAKVLVAGIFSRVDGGADHRIKKKEGASINTSTKAKGPR